MRPVYLQRRLCTGSRSGNSVQVQLRGRRSQSAHSALQGLRLRRPAAGRGCRVQLPHQLQLPDAGCQRRSEARGAGQQLRRRAQRTGRRPGHLAGPQRGLFAPAPAARATDCPASALTATTWLTRDDENGVVFTAPWYTGANGGKATVSISADGAGACSVANPCSVAMWIDWNGDGTFTQQRLPELAASATRSPSPTAQVRRT